MKENRKPTYGYVGCSGNNDEFDLSLPPVNPTPNRFSIDELDLSKTRMLNSVSLDRPKLKLRIENGLSAVKRRTYEQHPGIAKTKWQSWLDTLVIMFSRQWYSPLMIHSDETILSLSGDEPSHIFFINQDKNQTFMEIITTDGEVLCNKPDGNGEDDFSDLFKETIRRGIPLTKWDSRMFHRCFGLEGLELLNIDFSESIIRVGMNGCELRGCDFSKSNIDGITIRYSTFIDCDFSEAAIPFDSDCNTGLSIFGNVFKNCNFGESVRKESLVCQNNKLINCYNYRTPGKIERDSVVESLRKSTQYTNYPRVILDPKFNTI